MPSNSQGSSRQSADQPHRRRLEPLPRGLRVVLFAIGTALVAFGLVGIALPVVPQVLPLLLGAAILSLASDTFYKRSRLALRRWPRVSRRFRELRRVMHSLFARHHDR